MSTVKIKDEYGWQSVASIKESDPVLPKDVNFYDYDGTLVYSYTASEFLIHNMMPSFPEHKGLICQEWNWSIEKAKAHVLKYTKLDIGATYITDDGKTRVYIFIDDPALLTMRLAFTCIGSVTIDWGDGSSTETVSGTSMTTIVYSNDHTFPSIGYYVLSLVPNNVLGFYHGSNNDNEALIMPRNSYGNSVIRRRYYGLVEKIEFGKKIYNLTGPTSNADSAFRGFYNLKYVTIPNNILEGYPRCFQECSNLRCIIFPRGRDNIAYMMAYKDDSLSHIVMSDSMIASINSNCCESCISLKNVSLPDGLVDIGAGSFKNCYSITSVIIPSSVTTIRSNAFNACVGLHEVHFTSSTPPTLENSNAFSSISEYCKFYVPTGSLSAYTSATNYPDSSTYTYIEE